MIIKRGRIELNSADTVSLTPEDSDDLWSLYNLIDQGDELEAVTERRVAIGRGGDDGKSGKDSSVRMKMTLSVLAEKIDVDLENDALRINGKNTKENEHVKLGAYHTLELNIGTRVKLTKSCWDSLAISSLIQAQEDNSCKNEIGVVATVLGQAVFAVLSPDNSAVKKPGQIHHERILEHINVAFPKKKIVNTSEMEKTTDKFYEGIVEGMHRHFNFSRLKLIVIASSPPNLKDDILKKLYDDAAKTNKKEVNEARSSRKFLPIASNIGGASADPLMASILGDPRIQTLLADTKEAQLQKQLNQFKMLLTQFQEGDQCLIAIGPQQVETAASLGAISDLLINDTLYRCKELKPRAMYGRIIREVQRGNGKIHVFSRDSTSEKGMSNNMVKFKLIDLACYTGIAAILSFHVDLE